MSLGLKNVDARTVDGFGDEWTRFDQTDVDTPELEKLFRQYFAHFPWSKLPADAVGFDAGCGSGRWARFVAPKVGKLHCVDASDSALGVARESLGELSNCEFHHASVEELPLENESMDFGYSLGVLHHIPDTAAGLRHCVSKLKPGAPFLVYLYYACDNRPWWFRAVWQASDLVRRGVCRLPFRLRALACDLLAATVYWPLARAAWLLEKVGLPVDWLPLSAYRDRSFYSMRTDSLDRFGTRLEKRYTAKQVEQLLQSAGLEQVLVPREFPFWIGLGYKPQT